MKLKNKTELMIIIGAVICIVFAFIYPSVSLGLILGFIFAYINYKLIYSNLENVLKSPQVKNTKGTILNQIGRIILLVVFVFVAVKFHQYFNVFGIGIGIALALVGSVLDSRKKNDA